MCDIKKGSFLVDNIKKKNIEYNKNKTADGRESQNKKKEIKSHNLTKYGRAYGGWRSRKRFGPKSLTAAPKNWEQAISKTSKNMLYIMFLGVEKRCRI